MKFYFIALVLFISFGAKADTAPFGLTKGMTLAEVRKHGDFVRKDDPFIYSAKSIAKGHPDFDLYTVIITPEHGLCKISAASKTITTNVYGSALSSKFDVLFEALSQKYGYGKKYDFLKSGSIWKDPQDWMMALLKEERTLAVFWSKGVNSDLSNSLDAIQMKARAFSRNDGFIKIEYYFDNNDACVDYINAKKNSNL